jgi:DNA-binding transcriptional MerR regulator
MQAEDFKIGDLARMFGVTVRTLRYYEELGLLEPGERTESEHRRYPEKNVIYLKRIHQLKDYGLSLSEIQELFQLSREDRSGQRVRVELARQYRVKLDEAGRRHESLERYMADLRWHIEQLERVDDFFQCPGSSCPACEYRDRCDMRYAPEGMKERA